MAAFAGFLCVAQFSGVLAATFDDPEWPCIQRKVPKLSVGQMWAGPEVDETVLALAQTPGIDSLGTRLALRRTPFDEAQTLIDRFADTRAEDRAAQLTALFAATFGHVDTRRSAIIAGIGRYAAKQAALTARIETRRIALRELEAAAEPDFDRIELIRDELDWDTRIFRDRQQSLTFVCETPVILEQRIFAIARMIMAHLSD